MASHANVAVMNNSAPLISYIRECIYITENTENRLRAGEPVNEASARAFSRGRPVPRLDFSTRSGEATRLPRVLNAF